MRRYSDEFLETVRQATDIADVISDYVSLKPSGKRLKGLCPFHKEKTPSFTVSSDSGLYYCYGCHRGGNVFNFLIEIESISFPEAVKQLALRAGISLPALSGGDRGTDILSINAWANEIFHGMLLRGTGSSRVAMEYLGQRKISTQSIEQFKLGCAPDRWDFLVSKATEENMPLGRLLEAGLVLKRKDGSGYVDRFRNRLLFALQSPAGEILGFAGRVLPGSDDPAKYVNSPETLTYKKARFIYGFHQARKAIKERGRALLMEGYLDVIQAHQNGFSESLCVSGTALSSEQVEMIRRRVPEVILLFDGDHPGQVASERAVRMFLEGGVLARVGQLPEGEDPDSLLDRRGPDALGSIIEMAKPPMLFLIERVRHEVGGQSRKAVRALLPVLSSIPDPLLKEDAAEELARAFGYSTAAVLSLVRTPAKKMGKSTLPQTGVPEHRGLAWEEQLCRYLLMRPLSREDVFEEISADDFVDERLRALYAWMKAYAGQAHGNDLLTKMEDESIRQLAAAFFLSERPLAPLELLLARARLEHLGRLLRTLREDMREAERIGDTERVRDISAQIQEMSALAEGLKPSVRRGN